jgi:PAS domain S-box-containing protein
VTFVSDKGGGYVTAYGFDTTEWIAAEEKFKALVETINDWVWEVNTDGVYTYASPRVKDLLGYEPRELIGKTFFDFMAREEARRVRDIFERIIEAEESFAGVRNRCVCRDGTEVIVETAGSPIFDSGGKLIGYRGVDRDITDRVIVEDELRESRDFIENLIECSVDGILAYDMECRYTVWNPGMEKISGMSKEEVIGKCAFDVFPFLRDTGEDKLMLQALPARLPPRRTGPTQYLKRGVKVSSRGVTVRCGANREKSSAASASFEIRPSGSKQKGLFVKARSGSGSWRRISGRSSG